MEESWKPVYGFEGFYEISDRPRIKRIKAGQGTKAECMKQGNRRGYKEVRLCKNGKSSLHLVHRLVALSFIPNLENKPCVNHINGVKSDNRPENLEWVSYSENMEHSFNKGLHPKGNKHYNYKIPDEELGRVLDKSIPARIIAEEFGVSRGYVYDIRGRKKRTNKG